MWNRWSLALAASVAVIALGVTWRLVTTAPHYYAVAVVAEPDGRPLWRVSVAERGERIRITALGSAAPGPDKDFELWALSDTGGAPVSLGVMPLSGEAGRVLTTPQRAAVLAAHKVAITVEPRGGSPTGGPTGPVVHVADIQRGA